MISYALVLWIYLHTGSVLRKVLLLVCSYAPYVVMSIFAGALNDQWNKKRTMLVCDLLVALSTMIIYLLIRSDALSEWYLYVLNTLQFFTIPIGFLPGGLLVDKIFEPLMAAQHEKLIGVSFQ